MAMKFAQCFMLTLLRALVSSGTPMTVSTISGSMKVPYGRYHSFALYSLYLLYEEVFRIAPINVSNTEMMISKIMKGDGD